MGILVTLDEAKQHLKLTYKDYESNAILSDDSEDALITQYIDAASDYVKKYCQQDFEASPPASVRQAVLLLVGDYYNQREEHARGGLVATLTVQRLLAPYCMKLGV